LGYLKKKEMVGGTNLKEVNGTNSKFALEELTLNFPKGPFKLISLEEF